MNNIFTNIGVILRIIVEHSRPHQWHGRNGGDLAPGERESAGQRSSQKAGLVIVLPVFKCVGC